MPVCLARLPHFWLDYLTSGGALPHFGRCSDCLVVQLCSRLSITLLHCSPSAQLVSWPPCLAVNTLLYSDKFAVLPLIRCALVHWLCSHSLCSLLALEIPGFSDSLILSVSVSRSHSLILSLDVLNADVGPQVDLPLTEQHGDQTGEHTVHEALSFTFTTYQNCTFHHLTWAYAIFVLSGSVHGSLAMLFICSLNIWTAGDVQFQSTVFEFRVLTICGSR